MTDSMIEKVARAICVADGEGPDDRGDPRRFGDVTMDHLWPRWRFYKKHARAAIEAMREPTIRVLNEGAGMCADERGNPDETQARIVWEAMIDVALKEE